MDTLLDAPVLRRYTEVKEILLSPVFEQAAKVESHDFVGETLLTLDHDAHFTRRRLLSRLMKRATLTEFEHKVLDPTVEVAIAACSETRTSDGLASTDLVRFGRTIFLRLAGATIGLDDVGSQWTTDLLARYLDPLIEGTTIEWSNRPHEEVLVQGLEAKAGFLEDLIDPAISQREALIEECLAGRMEEVELPVDLLTILLLHVDVSELRNALEKESVLFLVASTLNNAATITHAVDELSKWVVDHPEDWERRNDDSFLSALVNEVLRFQAVTPALHRRATEAITLKSTGRIVNPGDVFALDIGAANHDPTVWGEDAGRFNPHRAVPPGEKGYGLAFGSGVHVCIGRPLVLGTYTDSQGEVGS